MAQGTGVDVREDRQARKEKQKASLKAQAAPRKDPDFDPDTMKPYQERPNPKQPSMAPAKAATKSAGSGLSPFGAAFAAARAAKGPGQVFEFPPGSGKMYTTDRADDVAGGVADKFGADPNDFTNVGPQLSYGGEDFSGAPPLGPMEAGGGKQPMSPWQLAAMIGVPLAGAAGYGIARRGSPGVAPHRGPPTPFERVMGKPQGAGSTAATPIERILFGGGDRQGPARAGVVPDQIAEAIPSSAPPSDFARATAQGLEDAVNSGEGPNPYKPGYIDLPEEAQVVIPQSEADWFNPAMNKITEPEAPPRQMSPREGGEGVQAELDRVEGEFGADFDKTDKAALDAARRGDAKAVNQYLKRTDTDPNLAKALIRFFKAL